ncbi:MAG: GFA family protein [Pseudomonadota bacterium]
MLVRGSCLCGAVGYEARLPFARFVNCHCSRCRKASGGAFSVNAYVLPDAFRWTRGENAVIRYDLAEARSFSSSFCGKCGSPVPHSTRSGREIIIPAGSLDDEPQVVPSANVHWGSRAGWSLQSSEIPTLD